MYVFGIKSLFKANEDKKWTWTFYILFYNYNIYIITISTYKIRQSFFKS